MDDRRDILITLGWRALIAVPLVMAAWFLFATTTGDPDGGGKRLLGLACVVAAGIIVAAPLAGLVAEPAGGLFYPRRRALPEPGYSGAEGRRKRGRYEEAIQEFQEIAAQFPAEVYPYVAMIEIAIVNLHDSARADAIATRGLATLRDDASRKHLLWMHGRIKGKLRAAPPLPAGENDGEADGAESDSEE